MNNIQIFQLKRAAIMFSTLADSFKDKDVKMDFHALAHVICVAVREFEAAIAQNDNTIPDNDTINRDLDEARDMQTTKFSHLEHCVAMHDPLVHSLEKLIAVAPPGFYQDKNEAEKILQMAKRK